MLLSFLCLYAIVAVAALALLAHKASDAAKPSDIWIGAAVWPVTAVKFIVHLLNH